MIVAISMVLILGFAGSTFYRNEEYGIRIPNEEKLRTLFIFKAGQLSAWYLNEMRDAELVAEDELFVELVTAYTGNPRIAHADRLRR